MQTAACSLPRCGSAQLGRPHVGAAAAQARSNVGHKGAAKEAVRAEPCQLVPVAQRPSQPLDLLQDPAHLKENQQVRRAPGHAQAMLVNSGLVALQFALASQQVPSAQVGGGPDLATVGARRGGRGGKHAAHHHGVKRDAQLFEAAVDGRLGPQHAAVPVTSGFGNVPIAVQLNAEILELGHHSHGSAAAAGRRQSPTAPARPGTAVPKHHRFTLGRVHQQPVLPTVITVAIDQAAAALRCRTGQRHQHNPGQ